MCLFIHLLYIMVKKCSFVHYIVEQSCETTPDIFSPSLAAARASPVLKIEQPIRKFVALAGLGQWQPCSHSTYLRLEFTLAQVSQRA